MPLLRSLVSLFLLGVTPLIALSLGASAHRRVDGVNIPRRTSAVKSWLRAARRLEGEPAPLSTVQKAIWAACQADSTGCGLHRRLAVRLDGDLDRSALQQTLERIVRRHEPLRTVFGANGGAPQQVVREAGAVALEVVDLGNVPLERQDAEARRIAEVEAGRAFDLGEGPLVRFKLLRLAERRHVLLVAAHEIVFDEWSERLFFSELTQIYASLAGAAPASLGELPIQYTDFAAWEPRRLQSPDIAKQVRHWRGELEGAPSSLHLPRDYTAHGPSNGSSETCSVTLSEQFVADLDALSSREGVPPLTALLAAYQFLLAYHADQDDVVVGFPATGRPYTQTENLIGCFRNTLPIRVRLTDTLTVRELLARVNDTLSGAIENSETPLEALVEELRPGSPVGRQSFFQAMFRLGGGTEPASAGALQMTPAWPGRGALAGADLGLEIESTGKELVCSLRYDTALFRRDTAERMLGHYRNIVEGMVRAPEELVWDLPVLGEAERRRLLVELNDTTAEFPADGCMHELFEFQAATNPDAVAVIFEGRQMTYGELNRRANQLAHHLRGLGAGPETLVGICLDRSLEMAVGLLGILKAGAAYVPLDPEYPQDRLEFLIGDAGTQMLLTQRSVTERLALHSPHVVCLDTDWEKVSGQSDENPASGVSTENVAYVIYTSGSTGKPKGVMIPHRAACNYLFWKKAYFGLGPDDRLLQRASLSFDDSMWEFFEPWMAGAAVVLLRPGGEMDSGYVVDLMVRERITVACFVPSMLRILLEEPRIGECTSLRRFETGAEVLPVEVRDRFLEKLPVVLYNGYGPTEATVACTVYPCVEGDRRATVPIGRPISNAQFYILGRRGQLVPEGAPGELCIGGAGLARGYLNRPELTAQKFISHPFSGDPGERLYRTGDLVRYWPDGNIEYLGRIDNQVKVRGFRIELEGVEHVMRQHPAVREAAAAPHQDQAGDTVLVGYFVPQRGREHVGAAVRQFLKEWLPDYMVPTILVELPALPYLTSGKIDRAALPHPEPRHEELARVTDELRTPTEKTLAGIWSEVLGASPIGRQDDFFALGGHSLSAARVILDARKTFQIEISVVDVFRYPTLAGMAGLIDSSRQAGPNRSRLS